MKKILIVEDDLDIQRIYFEKLTNSGFKVLLSVDGMQGIQIAKEERPNLILLDVMLPGKMNGIDLLAKIKNDSDLKGVPVIVTTNLDTEKNTAFEIGADDYLIKSNIDLNFLVEKVKKYI